MEGIFFDVELHEVALLVPMTLNDTNYAAGEKISAPADVIEAWRQAGIVAA